MGVVRVLVAEDAPVLRDTLVALLDLEPGIEVVAAVASGDQIVPRAVADRPDVALLDIGLPGVDGLAAAAELAERLPGCRVLILTGLDAPAHLAAARRARVSGFLVKDQPAEELIGAVRAVARGQQVTGSRLAGPPGPAELGPAELGPAEPGRGAPGPAGTGPAEADPGAGSPR